MKRGAFIVIDGIDGSGKSTQVRLLSERLSRAVVTHDPGGTETGEQIRSILLGSKTLAPVAVLMLFFASRAALLAEVIVPALKKGRIVLCDRFDSSTYAYQVVAGRHPEFAPFIRLFAKESGARARPDVYIILDGSPEKARERLFGSRGKELNAYDKKPLAYHRAVRAGFKSFRVSGSKIVRINADRAMDAVFEDVWAIVKRYAK